MSWFLEQLFQPVFVQVGHVLEQMKPGKCSEIPDGLPATFLRQQCSKPNMVHAILLQKGKNSHGENLPQRLVR